MAQLCLTTYHFPSFTHTQRDDTLPSAGGNIRT